MKNEGKKQYHTIVLFLFSIFYIYIVYRFCSIAFCNGDYNGDLSPPKRHVFIAPVFAFK